ncbi:neutral protease 2-like protein [Eremomyces bilateralis CBS 781.70]|uniref:Neutral protease 2 n=1 Tax=Eremomyces bilateralis CBS 781.70 TaxID=1392243 RepID=A0A6G1GC24_9PEZI|nr:neutral protease 2-like protein [Eremomyces bilateralis CBS 781.70]KAF1815637.1 neutral protease 2-like protein [Eremomyces bilateralis CBS 781.70]
MKFTVLCSILSCITCAYAAVASDPAQETEDPALSVVISAIDNSRVTISVTNVGSRGLNLLEEGTFLDPMPVQKVSMFGPGGAKISFTGIEKRVMLGNLEPDAFTAIEAGQTLEFELDVASVHDIRRSGEYRVSTSGAIPYAELGSTELTGESVHYRSNEIVMEINWQLARRVKRAIPLMTAEEQTLHKRTRLNTDCTGSRKTSTLNALKLCAQYSELSATAAQSGDAAKFEEYFKTSDASTRSTVAARFQAVAKECNSTTTGGTTYRCRDRYFACRLSTLAYTVPSQNVVVNCPMYFSYLPLESKQCHGQDQWSTTLHEFTHAPAVVKPGTNDNGYGYSAQKRLSARSALDNADSYALYANALVLKC